MSLMDFFGQMNLCIAMCYIFLETSGQRQLNINDSRHHGHLQEDQDDQECPPTSGSPLWTFKIKTSLVLYVFGMLK